MGKKKNILLRMAGSLFSIIIALLVVIFVGEKLFFASFFFGGARKEMKTPGTWTSYVQQGFDRLDDGKFLVSAYNKNDENAALFVMDGRKTDCVELKNEDGSPYVSHAGGVTHYQQWVYVATDNHIPFCLKLYRWRLLRNRSLKSRKDGQFRGDRKLDICLFLRRG